MIPAVVQIQALGYAPVPGRGLAAPGVVAAQRSTGSGVILDTDGYIVTNAHVVAGAQRVQVTLALYSGEKKQWLSLLKPPGKTVPAQIVGIDQETDLAVLRIDEKGLAALELGDSDRLRQGELALAFGSPLGLENSVSMGVVSAIARQLRPEDPMVYIQTDAPINPGNSGGPLVDVLGRVIGINTLILSQSGGSEGLGFAAPSNIVRTVLRQIRKSGRVRRGHIGVTAQTVTPALAAGLGLSRNYGVIIADVQPEGPASDAGLKVGDLVLTLDGKLMENARQFDVNLYQRAVGDGVTLEVLRGSEKLTRQVTVIERTDDPLRFSSMVSREKNYIEKLGILGLELDEKLAGLIPQLRKPAGVVVAALVAEGNYQGETLLAGDLIVALNREPVLNLEGLQSSLDKLKSGDVVVMQVQRLGQLLYVVFELR